MAKGAKSFYNKQDTNKKLAGEIEAMPKIQNKTKRIHRPHKNGKSADQKQKILRILVKILMSLCLLHC